MVEAKLEKKYYPEMTKFFANFAIISTFIAFALGFSFDKIMTSLSEGIISPFLQLLMQTFGVKKLFFSFRGVQFKLYPFISSAIVFGIIFGILYAIFAKALRPQLEEIIEYRSKNELQQIDLQKQTVAILEEQKIDAYQPAILTPQTRI